MSTSVKVPHSVFDAVGGYNNITDEFFIFRYPNMGYKFSYKNRVWSDIHVDIEGISGVSQYYTQHGNVIYYYVDNAIKTYNMTYPYSNMLSIGIKNITLNAYPCLSADISGNLFLSSGGFTVSGNVLNYYGYNSNKGIWQTFRHSEYWNNYNYDMRGMACIVHKQILYTFGGDAGGPLYLSEYYGSNMISYHDVSDYNKPFLSKGYSLWKKSPQELKQPGGYMRAVSVGELIYIIGGHSWNNKADGSCCIRGFNDVQIFDPLTHSIKGKIDGVSPLPFDNLYATTCHYHSKTYTLNCFGGTIQNYSHTVATNKWIYSNILLSESPSKSPTNFPSNSPSTVPTTMKPIIDDGNFDAFQKNLTLIFGSLILCIIIIFAVLLKKRSHNPNNNQMHRINQNPPM